MKPEIGWFIKKLSLKEQCSRILDEKNKKSVDSILMAREKILLLIEGNKNDPYVNRATKGCKLLKEQAEKLQKQNVNSSSDSDYIDRKDDVDDVKFENKNQQVNNDQPEKSKK